MRRLVKRGGEALAYAQYPDSVPTILAALLRARGVADAEEFLRPERGELADPFLLAGMREAAERLKRAKDAGERVCVWGDYDVDGVSATALMLGFFDEWGVNARSYIPSRHKEGYGLNEDALREIAEEADLLLTVDNGISEKALVARAMEMGLDVIVTDHHRPGDRVPECTVIDPLLNDYHCPYLCGAGVAFKLACALDADIAMKYIDLVALATVADVVPLTGENRTLTAKGLRAINDSPRPCFQAMLETAGMAGKTVRAENIAFQIAPRLNAGGRIGDAARSLNLLMAKTKEAAMPAARELEGENTRRKEIEKSILRDVEAMMADYPLVKKRAIVLAGDHWNKGVIGLAASRVVEKYHYPVILLSREDGVLTGSCRSIDGVDIYAALTAASAHLTRYGGHKQAAGLTMAQEHLAPFEDALNQFIEETCPAQCFVPAVEYDAEIDMYRLCPRDVEALEGMQPTGFGNPAPVFLSRARVETARAIGADGSHLKIRFEDEGELVDGVWFRHGADAARLRGRYVEAVYAPKVDRYAGREDVQCHISDINIARLSDSIASSSGDYVSFLTDRLYNNQKYIFSDAPGLSRHKWLSLIEAYPRGTLLTAASPVTAKRAARAIEDAGDGDKIDVYCGGWPDDGKGFNALCVLPCGRPPEGYARIVSLDAPACLYGDMPEGMDLFEDENAPAAAWLGTLPDVDMLRELYKAVRRMLSRPYLRRDARMLYKDLRDSAGLSTIQVMAGLLVLDHMGLIGFSHAPVRIEAKPPFKADPEDDGAYRWLRAIAAWKG